MTKASRIKDILGLINAVAVTVILASVGVLIYQGVTIYQNTAANPFYGATQHTAWLCDPQDRACNKHIEPPGMVFVAAEDGSFPLGRTICVKHLTDATIYKEIDDDHGGSWPVGGSTGAGSRDLLTGCHDRISPTVLFPAEPGISTNAPPPGPGYTFRVWFNVARGILPPLVVPLEDVKLTLLPPVKK